MATLTAAVAKHATLTAATVDTVTLGSDFNSVKVINWGTTAGTAGIIYFTVNGATPTVGGDDTYPAGPNGGDGGIDVPTSGATVVKLICTSAHAYSVVGS